MSSARRGFTLLEIMIVLLLIGIVMGIAIPSITGTKRAQLEGQSRELATLIRTVFDESVLKGRVYRVVFDLDQSQYWVEQGPQQLTLLTEDQQKEKEYRDRRLSEEERKQQATHNFAMAKDVLRDKKKLSRGVKIVDLLAAQQKQAVTAGTVYIHAFPHGFLERGLIHIKDDEGRYATLLVDSVTGKSKYFVGYILENGEAKDMKGP